MAKVPLKTALPVSPALTPPRLLLMAVALVGLIGLGLPVPTPAGATGGGQDLQVIDGDTLQSGTDIIQLYGIDAPELGQVCQRDGKPWACGVDAAFALQKLVSLSGSPVVCKAWRESRQARGPNRELIRVCLVGADQDLAQAMLRNGYGMALPGSFPYYGQIERQARQAGLGIWGSEFTPPWKWRAGDRQKVEAGQPHENCNVITSVASTGERVYLVPTDADYQNAAAQAADGQPRFCSDEAARKDGWRRASQTEGGTVR